MLITVPILENVKITKVVCPCCKERASRVGLLEGSKINGLVIVCKKCKTQFTVTAN